MARQKLHYRRSKKGKKFLAGRREKAHYMREYPKRMYELYSIKTAKGYVLKHGKFKGWFVPTRGIFKSKKAAIKAWREVRK